MRKIACVGNNCSQEVEDFVNEWNDGQVNTDDLEDEICEWTTDYFCSDERAFNYLENENYTSDFSDAIQSSCTNIESIAEFYLAQEIRDSVEFIYDYDDEDEQTEENTNE